MVTRRIRREQAEQARQLRKEKQIRADAYVQLVVEESVTRDNYKKEHYNNKGLLLL